MATYEVTSPDGKTWEVTAPDSASQDEVLAYAKKQWASSRKSLAPMNADPTEGMSGTDKFLAGVGKAMTDVGRGAGQMVGLVSRGDVEESRRLDAPLMKTGAGVAGNLAGNVAMLAPTAMIPGANTIGGAGTIGAVTGLLQPSTSTGETALNVGLGGVGGAVGQKIANAVPQFVAGRRAAQTAKDAAGAQRMGAAREAVSAGYVIPPEDLGGGAVVKAMSGLGGKIKTAQEASARNQTVTNKLAKKALGVAEDAPLNLEALKAIRADAGKAYDAFRTVGQVVADAPYNKALDDVLSSIRGAAKSFPGLKADKVETLVDTMRQPAFDAGDAIDATKVLRELAETAYAQGDKQLGKAYRSVSDAIENALDRHLQQTAPSAVKDFRKARELYAKTWTVERALNEQTGDVSAQALAIQLKRGKPLSGELKTAAKAGQAFPKATQALKETPKTLSPLDFGAAGLALMTSGGNPLGAAGLVARPAVRNMLLSSPMQRSMLNGSAKTPVRNALLEYLARDPVLLPAGVLSGLGAASGLSAYLKQ